MPNWNAINNTLSKNILQADRLDELLESLGCNLKTRNYSSYRGPCPIHGGTSDSLALEVGEEEDTLPVRWNCFSHECHDHFKPSLLGLVRGVLSAQQKREVRLQEATDYLSRFTGGTAPNLGTVAVPRKSRQAKLLNIAREDVRHSLDIPSPYFVSRGFSTSVLDAFDVGDSIKLKRAVVPLYDMDDGRTCIGYLGRSYRPPCDQCEKHHDGPECRFGQAKWVMPEGFPSGSYIYNYSAAKATASPFVFVVEGAPDVLKLAEVGLVGVALLGSYPSDEQVRKLAALGKEIWTAFDNDDAGRKANQLLAGRLNVFRFQVPESYKDVGDTPADELIATFRSQAEGMALLCEALGDDASLWQQRMEWLRARP